MEEFLRSLLKYVYFIQLYMPSLRFIKSTCSFTEKKVDANYKALNQFTIIYQYLEPQFIDNFRTFINI